MRKYILFFLFNLWTFTSYSQCDQVTLEQTSTNDCLPIAAYNLTGEAPAGSSVEWTWIDNPGNAQLLFDEDNDFVVFVSMTNVGMYSLQMEVTLSSGESCTKIFEKELFPLTDAIIDIPNSFTMCDGSVELNLILDNAEAFQEVDWIINQSFSSDFEASFVLTEAAQYELNIITEDIHGCVVNSIENFTVIEGPAINNTSVQLTSSLDNTTCLDPNTLYNVSTDVTSDYMPNSIYWQNTNQTTLLDHSIEIIVANTSEQNFIYPILLNFDDCTLSYNLEHSYTTTQPVSYNSSYTENPLCAGEIVTLSNTSNQLLYDPDFTWSIDGATVLSETVNSVSFTYDQDGTYEWSLSYNGACSSSYTESELVDVDIIEPLLTQGINQLSCEDNYTLSLDHSTQLEEDESYNYLWTIGSDLTPMQTSSSETPSFELSQSGSYDLNLTISNDDGACSGSLNYPNFFTLGAISVTLVNDIQVYCSGQNIQTENLIDNPQISQYSYTWSLYNSDNNLVSSAVGYNSNLSVAEVGLYTVELHVEDTQSSCESTVSGSIIQVQTAPQVNILSEDLELCSSSDIDINAELLIDAEPLVVFDWTLIQELTEIHSSSSSDFEFTLDDTGVYTLLAEFSVGNCVGSDQIEISYEDLFADSQWDIQTPEILCEGDIITPSNHVNIPVSNNVEVQWNLLAFNTGEQVLSSNDLAAIFIPPPGNYGLEVLLSSNINSCSFQDIVSPEIIINESPEFQLDATNVSTCELPYTLEVNIDGSSELATYNWGLYLDNNLASNGENNFEYTFTDNGSYVLVYTGISTENLECISSQSIDVDVNNLIVNYLNNSPGVQCENFFLNTADYFDLSAIQYAGYNWQLLNQSSEVVHVSTDSNASFIIDESGTYDLSLQLFSEINECIYDTLLEDFVTILDLNFALDDVLTSCTLPYEVDFEYNADLTDVDMPSFLWTLYDTDGTIIETINQEQANFTYNDIGSYNISLTITDQQYGCFVSQLKENAVIIDTVQVTLDENTSITTSCLPYSFSAGEFDMTSYADFNYLYLWSLIDVDGNTYQTANNSEGSFTIYDPGVYDLQLEVTNLDANCYSTQTIENAVQANQLDLSLSIEESENCFNDLDVLTKTIKVDPIASSLNIPFNIVNNTWLVLPSEGVNIVTSNQDSLVLELSEPGEYTVSCLLTIDNNSCQISEQLEFEIGIEAQAEVPELVCVGAEFIATSNVFVGTSSSTFQWSSIDSSIEFLNPQQQQSEFYANEPGNYTIDFYATNDLGCYVQLSNDIEVYALNALVTSPDSGEQCRPAVVDFQSTNNEYVSSYTWNVTQKFEDDTINYSLTTLTPDLTYLLSDVGLTDVELIIESDHGCADTSSLYDFVDIIAPLPYFSLEPNFAGCDSFEVHLIDSSNFIDNYFVDVGTGFITDYTIGDTTTVLYHYPYGETNAWYYEYYISIQAEYKFCEASYLDTVRVYPRPQIDISVSDTQGCAPFTVSFNDNSMFAYQELSSYTWDFGDGESSLEADPIHTFEEPGVYEIFHSVTTQNQCYDDTLWVQNIEVYEPPIADFTAEITDYCYGLGQVQFEDLSTHDSDSLSYLWSLFFENSTEQNPIFSFESSGSYPITLELLDSHGCSHDTTQFVDITVLDTIVELPVIDYVSVIDDNVFIQWADSLDDNFDNITLFHKANVFNNWNQIYNTSEVDVNSFTHSPVNELEVNDYTIIVEDSCGYVSENSVVHSTILLNATSSSFQTVNLEWTKYIGWDYVDSYNIFRKESGESYELIAQIDGDSLSFTDRGLCNVIYTYYVQALHPESLFSSNSNEVNIEPLFIDYSNPVLLKYTTVDGDASIRTEWATQYESQMTYYIIDRWDTYFGWVEDYAETSETPFIDQDVESDHRPYIYRIAYRDYCGNEGPFSRVGTNIVLSGEEYYSHYELNWTPYQIWSGGVKSYTLQYFNNATSDFSDIATLDGDDYYYLDSDLTKPGLDTSYCYRIVAHSYEADSIMSYSNIQCFVPNSKVYFPNAFSPNGDNINDTFSFEGDFAKYMSVKIFDRWANLVYSSTDVNFEWDGTSLSTGKPCQQGAYSVYYEIEDFNNYIIKNSSSLIILR